MPIAELLWTLAVVLTMSRYIRNNKNLPLNLYFLNSIFAWVLILIHGEAIASLGWAIGHPDLITPHIYKRVGDFPPMMNALLWLSSTFLGLLVIFTSIGLLNGKDMARKIFLKIVIVVYVLSAVEFLKGFIGESSMSTSLKSVGLIVSFVVVGIPYGTFWYFYTRKRVRDLLFRTYKANGVSQA